jgi:ribonuclease HII
MSSAPSSFASRLPSPSSLEGRRVAGVDEVGRGPLAGPVVVAAVILDPDDMPEGLGDSKALSPARREKAAAAIFEKALAISIASSSAATIDRVNIREATLGAMARAVRGLAVMPARVLVDGRDRVPGVEGCEAIIGGDAREACISAASIIAKVARDRLMRRLDRVHGAYGFGDHAGYGTPRHLAALAQHGPCAHHRFSFAPIRGCWRRD